MATIREAGTLTTTQGQGRFLIQLITPGVGSSGTYPQEVLEAAGRERVFGAGCKMFIDHQTDEEAWHRPEGSLKDLAAVLTEDAHWDDQLGALVAEARVFEHWKPVIESMKDDIGVSIRAGAEVQETSNGRVITKITEARSVDFVTQAGRGGKILEVLESKRAQVEEKRNVGTWFEARLHQMFTNIADDQFGDGALTREERITLSGAIGDALGAFTAKIDADAPQLYQRDLWDDPEQPVAQETSQPRLAETEESTNRKDAAMATVQIEEAQHTELIEKASRVDTLEARIHDYEAREAADKRRTHVAGLVEKEFENVDDPAGVAELLIERHASTDTPDTDIITEARARAEKLTAAAGGVHGLGESAPIPVGEVKKITSDDIVNALEGR